MEILQYFITFVDDLSQNAWAYFLKQKKDACENFKIFKSYVEKQSVHTIKILRTNKDTKYTIYDDFFFNVVLSMI